MNIQLTTSLSVAPNRLGKRPQRRRRPGPRGQKAARVNKSAADLDADLDAHNANMQTE